MSFVHRIQKPSPGGTFSSFEQRMGQDPGRDSRDHV